MVKNYKVGFASTEQPQLQLISTVGSINTWRVYFDVFEHEEERKTETAIVEHKETVTRTVTDPETGEEMEYTEEVITYREEEIEIRVYEAKYIDIRKHKSVTPTALQLMKEYVINEITEYDLSTDVNSFYLNGNTVWLDKDTRVGLMNSTNIQKSAGMETTVLWLGTTALTINCDLAIQMLGALEMYALDCFNKTAEHKKNVKSLETVDAVAGYDYTAGYPEKLNLTI